ncbi:MAG: cation-transporting P-type ATPase [Nitrososphaerales archaeon]
MGVAPSEEKDLPLAELLRKLSTTEKGLSSSEAAERLQRFGPNLIVEKRQSRLVAFLRYFWGPIAWMIEAAAVISAFIQH